MALQKDNKVSTYADYLALDVAMRAEIMGGQLVMRVLPSRIHQRISGEIRRQLANYIDGDNSIYAAPFAVRLFENPGELPEDVKTVLEPDICVICDKHKIDSKGCKGAPDLIVEVVSLSSMEHDTVYKLGCYEKAGVREYWIIYPDEKTAQVYLLKNHVLKLSAEYDKNDSIKTDIIPGAYVELYKVFVL